LRSAADLLRGILAYVFCLSSFRQVGSWAASIGLSANGERSWAKRTRQASGWLLWLLQALLAPTPTPGLLGLPEFAGRIHLVDATHLRTWQRNGESRRLHVSYDLLASRIEEVLLTDHHMGEGLGHFQRQPGDITVGDSAYCRRGAIMAELDARAEVVVRLHWSSTPLQQADGLPFDLSSWLSNLSEGHGEQAVWIQVRKRRVRLLAVRLSEAAAQRAQRKRKTKARTSGRKSQPLSIQVADWLLVLTSLQEQHWSAQQVLALYRARWQIELLFKRIKQLVRLHRLRSNVMQSNQAVLAALLVGWALLEQQARLLRHQVTEKACAPAERSRPQHRPLSYWEVCATLVQSLRTMILGSWTWAQIQAHLDQLTRLLTVRPQTRGHQESQIVQQLTQLLSLLQS